MEISDKMVLYIIAGAVLIVAIIVTKGAIIGEFFRSISGCLTWALAVLSVLSFVMTIIFLAIPDPIFLEIWLAILGTVLGTFSFVAKKMGKISHSSSESDTLEVNNLPDTQYIPIIIPSDTEIRRIINSQEEFPDQETIQEIIKKAQNKLEDDTEFENSTGIESIIDNSSSLLRLIRAYASKNYREIPMKSILAAVAAITYFVNPYDMIPDSIPGVGHIDDAAVIDFTLNLIHEDLEKFRKWEQQNENG